MNFRCRNTNSCTGASAMSSMPDEFSAKAGLESIFGPGTRLRAHNRIGVALIFGFDTAPFEFELMRCHGTWWKAVTLPSYTAICKLPIHPSVAPPENTMLLFLQSVWRFPATRDVRPSETPRDGRTACKSLGKMRNERKESLCQYGTLWAQKERQILLDGMEWWNLGLMISGALYHAN
jgi:hypothetical protein